MDEFEAGFVTVLNDVVKAGDRIAIAVGAGRYGSGMRTGTILKVGGTELNPQIKVRVEQSSGYGGHDWQTIPYIKTFPHPERMVKL